MITYESLLRTRSDEPREITQRIMSNPIYDDVSTITVDGIVKEPLFDDRYYLHTIPKDTDLDTYDLIIFYHGSRGIAWTQILEYTKLCTLDKKYLIAFGQASGVVSKPKIDPNYGSATFGEIYWEIRHGHPQLTEDIMYTRSLVGDMKDQYPIRNTYLIGHSNGGVFALLLALYVPNLFTGIVSHMGGLGYDPGLQLNFNLLRSDDVKPPILFYTGEHDLHRVPCEVAKNIFANEGFHVDLIIKEGIGHEYLPSCEPIILDWFKKN